MYEGVGEGVAPGGVMKAMVLAAGKGTRMGALTSTTPKPLLELNGETLIERHLRRLAAAGIEQVVVNLSHLGAQIRARLGEGARYGIAIRYSEEGEPPLETAGGIIRALPLLGTQPFLLLNADVVTDIDLGALAHETRLAQTTDGWLGTLVLVPNPAHHPRGDFGLAPQARGGTVAGARPMRGRLSADPPLLTYGGIAVLQPRLFAGYPDGPRPLKPILDAALARAALDGVRHDGLWLDVGTPERLRTARELLREAHGI